MSSFIKNLITILGLALIAALGYYLFVLNKDSGIDITDISISNQAEAEAETQAFLRRLNELKNINLSGEIFSDRRFQSLVDFGTPVDPSQIGRENPFAPVE